MDKQLHKVLVLRLKVVLAGLISKFQNAFVSGRQITGCFWLANECIDARLKKRKSGVVCKIDMEKAYGHT